LEFESLRARRSGRRRPPSPGATFSSTALTTSHGWRSSASTLEDFRSARSATRRSADMTWRAEQAVVGVPLW